MGALIDREKLERNKAEREERKAKIVDAARRCFLRMPFSQVTMESIARVAKVREGQPALFFGSTEELFLVVLGQELSDWCSFIEGELQAAQTPLGGAAVAEVLATSLAERTVLTRLLALAPWVQEQHAEPLGVVAFARLHHDWIVRLGELLEARVDAIREGDGVRFMRRLHTLIPGLQAAARPTGMGAVAAGDPEMPALSVDFASELRELLELLLSSE